MSDQIFVNTHVVKALMYLSGITESALAALVHVKHSDLQAWLYEQGDDSEERVPIEAQMEVLGLLGVRGEGPRNDRVHFWRVHEPFFSRPQNSYWALQVLLKAFGEAQAVFIGRESDPYLTTTAKAHFALKFEGFTAMLEVTTHPLRNVSFGPEILTGLTWVPETMGALLPDDEYDQLEPGAMKVKGMSQYLTYTTEVRQWDRLRDKALEFGIRPDMVANLLLAAHPNIGKLSVVPEEPAMEQRKAAPTVAPKVQTLDAARSTQDDVRLFTSPVKAAPLQRVV
jgi:hypothetical protein